jgi:hypothetical protein
VATLPCPAKRHPGALCRQHRRWLSDGYITIDPQFVVLDHVGVFYRGTGRLADADKAFCEAPTIYRETSPPRSALPHRASQIDLL